MMTSPTGIRRTPQQPIRDAMQACHACSCRGRPASKRRLVRGNDDDSSDANASEVHPKELKVGANVTWDLFRGTLPARYAALQRTHANPPTHTHIHPRTRKRAHTLARKHDLHTRTHARTHACTHVRTPGYSSLHP